MAINKVDNTKKKLLDALADARGIVSTACNNCDISRTTFYNYVNEDEDFKSKVEEINEAAIDYVESKLFEKITGVSTIGRDGEVYDNPPSDTAIIFYLKTKGKKRGYVERQEVAQTDKDGNDVTIFQIPDNGRG